MKHFLKNILIIDRERSGPRTDSRVRLPISMVAVVDIMLIEETTGYWVEKNRYGSNDYWFPKERLPEFLLDPSKDYSIPQELRIAPYYSHDDDRDECSCHINPPCSFCTSMNEEEANIMANSGLEALRRYRSEMSNV